MSNTNEVRANYLALSWSTSKGRDTYGDNICRLDDRETDLRYKCMGGGYDMIGTVIGKWLADVYQDRLNDLFSSSPVDPDRVYFVQYSDPARWLQIKDLHGIAKDTKTNEITLDGACSKESMVRIARAIGVSITSDYNKRKRCTNGFFATDFGSEEELIKVGR